MSASTDLILAILPEFCRSESDAEAILVAAAAARVEPLDYCSHRYRLGAEEMSRRAARWLGVEFSRLAPRVGVERSAATNLDRMVRKRWLGARVADREVMFVAPQLSDALRLKARLTVHPEEAARYCITTARAVRAALVRRHRRQLLDGAINLLHRRWPLSSAGHDLERRTRAGFVGVGLALAVLAGLAPLVMQTVLLPLLGLVLVIPGLFRLLAVAQHFRAPATLASAPLLNDAQLPVYTVLIPLYDEAAMVPLLARVMRSLDYPPEKLDIKFVVEERSADTVAAVKAVLDDDRFELVQVPDALPRTKPKALNYALPMARGAHIVVYDAEDIPNRDQLRLAAGAFAANVGVDCLQAELLIDNARENTLTALFAGEYAGQFGVMLAALARWGLPMPLGGTSNHFRTTSLREMGGWDAFNVTEDADLGVRLARLRYTTDMLPSQTGEEAPISITAWMRQRTRWMKGWMQTFIVHNRHPHALLRDLGWKGFAAFEIYVGSMILSPVLHTVFLTSMLVRFLAGRPPLSPSMLETGLLVLLVIFGYGGSFALVAAGLLRLGQKRLLAAQLLLPFYWVLHSIATARAAVELLTRPHFWAKTTHGLTRLERSFETDRRAPLSLLRKSHLEQPDTAAPTAPHDSGISLEML